MPTKNEMASFEEIKQELLEMINDDLSNLEHNLNAFRLMRKRAGWGAYRRRRLLKLLIKIVEQWEVSDENRR